jgi:trimeric autotransporter adhesin
MHSSGRQVRHRTLAGAVPTAVIAVLFVTGLQGCDDDPSTSPFVQSIGVALADESLTLEQGETATVTVAVTRGGGYAGAVTLSLTEVPDELTAALDPVSLSGSGTSTLTLTAGQTAVPGIYDLVVTGSGAGVASRSATLSVTIIAPSQSPSIDVALGAAALSLPQGQSGTVGVDISRSGGYTGDVSLAASGLPAGVTAAFNPAPVSGSSSVLTLAASSGATPGSYTITVTGSGTGVSDASATLTLTVTTPSPSPFIGVRLNADEIWVARGGSRQWEAIVTRGNGFTGTVSLTIEGLPPNVAATLTPSSLSAGVNGSLLTLTAESGAATGTTNVTVRATGAGVPDATVVVPLSVVAP